MFANDEMKERYARLDKVTAFLRSIGQDELAAQVERAEFVTLYSAMDADTRYWEISEHIWQLRLDRLLEDELSLQGAIFDKSKSYNTVLLSVGYAGFFAIWTQISAQMTALENAWAGLLLGVSLFVFVIWTLLISLALTKHVAARAKTISEISENEKLGQQEVLDAIQNANSGFSKLSLALQAVWPLVFGFTSLTGIAAGGILLLVLVETVCGQSISEMFDAVLVQLRALFA